jgi:DNA repair protein RecO (recombination protein O)
MDERTAGLILRTRPLAETSLIVHWLTRDHGRISTVAKGARRPKSPFRGKLDLFYLADLSFQPSHRSELHLLKEVSVRGFHLALRQELGYLQQAAYFARLLEESTEQNTPLPGLLSLMNDVLEFLPLGPPAALTIFAFEVKLLATLGLKPDLEQSNLSSGAREILERLAELPWTIAARIKMTTAQIAEADRFLHRFMVFEFGRCPRSSVGEDGSLRHWSRKATAKSSA